MQISPAAPPWRTKPCRFFAVNEMCIRGSTCPFTHIDEDGNDLHESRYLHEIEWQCWPEVEDLSGTHEGFEEVDLTHVGAMEEFFYEDDESLRRPPYFGSYPGSGSSYVGTKLIKVVCFYVCLFVYFV